MPEILPWNNAFSGAGGGGANAVGASPMQLPNPEGINLLGAMAQGQSIAASRQNMLAQQQQMEQSKTLFPMQMAQARTQIAAGQQNMLLVAEKYKQSQLLGDLYRQNIGPDGQVNYNGVAMDIAKNDELRSVAADALKSLIDTKGVDAQAVSKEIENGITKNDAIAKAIIPLYTNYIAVGKPPPMGEIARIAANLSATGVISSEDAKGIITMLNGDDKTRMMQVGSFIMGHVKDLGAQKAVFGELKETRAGGTTYIRKEQMGPDGQPITSLVDALSDTATTEQQLKMIPTKDADGNIVHRPASQVPVSMGGLAPESAAQMPGMGAGMRPVVEPSSVKKSIMDKDLEKYTKQREELDSQVNVMVAQVPYLERTLELASKGVGGPGTTVYKSMASLLSAFGMEDRAEAVAGGDLGALQEADFLQANAALGFYKRAGIANRDLSANEIETAAKANFTIDMNPATIKTLTKFMLAQAKYYQQKQQFMSTYATHYGRNPLGQFDKGEGLGEAEAAWNKFAKKLGYKELTPTQRSLMDQNAVVAPKIGEE